MLESLNIFGKIEKLIKEHGSASILRDHVNFLREQFAIFEKENASLKEEKLVFKERNVSLKNKINKLESKFKDATEEINRLNEVIKTFQENQSIEKLEEITEKTLKIFFDKAKELDVDDFTSVLSIQLGVVQYHFDILLKNKLIVQTRAGALVMGITSPPGFSITSRGRDYVIKKHEHLTIAIPLCSIVTG